MTTGDKIFTPRFGRVEIEKVFENLDEAIMEKYTEPTHYGSERRKGYGTDKDGYAIFGKTTSINHMIFAAVKI